jgi:MFS family permease
VPGCVQRAAVLVGVAIVIAVGECGQFIVLGPIVSELAPPHLLGRYMSLYSLSFMAGVALGPAVGGALLATSPDAVWWGGGRGRRGPVAGEPGPRLA